MSDRRVTRRRVLAIAGAGLLAIAAFGRWKSIGAQRHIRGGSDESSVDKVVLETVVDFIAIYFGVSLSSVDRNDLEQRLAISTKVDSNWRTDYGHLADIANSLAQQHDALPFSAASKQARIEIVADMLPPDQSRRMRRLRLFLMLDHREMMRMQESTIPHLARLYRSSGVPWRRRGYTSWPGVPGDTFAYASKLATTGC